MRIHRNMHFVAACLGAIWLLSAILGCGRPQAASENRQLIASLRTAVNTRNTEWLEKNAKIVEERRQAGQMADAEYEEFQRIIGKARAGEWEEAEREVIKFEKAQRPIPEDMQRGTERRLRRKPETKTPEKQ